MTKLDRCRGAESWSAVGAALAASGALGVSVVCFAQAVPSDLEILRTLAPELSEPRVGFELPEAQSRKSGREQALGYRFEADLNSDDAPDVVLLGPYRDGKSYLLVATRKSGSWVRSAFFTFERPYIVGYINTVHSARHDQTLKPGQLFVFFCESCDWGGFLEWSGSEYSFQEFAPPGPQ